MAVVTGVGVGWILSETARLGWNGPPRWAGGGARARGVAGPRCGRSGAPRARRTSHEGFRTTQIERLDATLRALGGYRFVRSCGHPSTNIAYASILAWYTQTEHRPGRLPAEKRRQAEPAGGAVHADRQRLGRPDLPPAGRQAGALRPAQRRLLRAERGHPRRDSDAAPAPSRLTLRRVAADSPVEPVSGVVTVAISCLTGFPVESGPHAPTDPVRGLSSPPPFPSSAAGGRGLGRLALSACLLAAVRRMPERPPRAIRAPADRRRSSGSCRSCCRARRPSAPTSASGTTSASATTRRW